MLLLSWYVNIFGEPDWFLVHTVFSFQGLRRLVKIYSRIKTSDCSSLLAVCTAPVMLREPVLEAKVSRSVQAHTKRKEQAGKLSAMLQCWQCKLETTHNCDWTEILLSEQELRLLV